MRHSSINIKALFVTTVVVGLCIVSALEHTDARALTYLSPWGGITAEKEAKIVQWAAKRAGVDVDIQYPAGGVQGVRDQLFVYQATGIPVDIVWNHQSTHFQFADQNAWLNLRPFFDADPLLDIKDFVPASLRFFTDSQGKILAIPFRWSFTTINYNKELFDQSGLPYPDNTWTYEGRFYQAAKKLTRMNAEGKTTQFGVAPFRLHDFIWRAWGADTLTPDKSAFGLNTEAGRNSLQFLRNLYAEGTAKATTTMTPFVNQTVGMIFENPILEYSQENLRWDLAHVPLGPTGERVARGAIGAWSIPSWCPDPQAAWKLLRELSSYEGQLRYIEEGLGGTRIDSLQQFFIRNYNPQNFASTIGPDSFKNRNVYLEAMQYAEVDVDRTRLNVTEMSSLLGSNGAITKLDRPVPSILEELAVKVNTALAELKKTK